MPVSDHARTDTDETVRGSGRSSRHGRVGRGYDAPHAAQDEAHNAPTEREGRPTAGGGGGVAGVWLGLCPGLAWLCPECRKACPGVPRQRLYPQPHTGVLHRQEPRPGRVGAKAGRRTRPCAPPVDTLRSGGGAPKGCGMRLCAKGRGDVPVGGAPCGVKSPSRLTRAACRGAASAASACPAPPAFASACHPLSATPPAPRGTDQ